MGLHGGKEFSPRERERQRIAPVERRCPSVQGVDHPKEKAHGKVRRQDVDDDVVWRQLPCCTRPLAVGQNFCMRVWNDLGQPGRAGRCEVKRRRTAFEFRQRHRRTLDGVEFTRFEQQGVGAHVVAQAGGQLIEVQGTAEHAPFNRPALDQMLELALKGLNELQTLQRQILTEQGVRVP